MSKIIKAMTLEEDVVDYIERLSKLEHRNFSNMVNVIVKRYRKIVEQLDQGIKLDTIFSK